VGNIAASSNCYFVTGIGYIAIVTEETKIVPVTLLQLQRHEKLKQLLSLHTVAEELGEELTSTVLCLHIYHI
jgi:hypothetical protein